MPDWSILQNALQSNPGESFRQGMARGLMGSAMQGNGTALNALMGVDPASAAAMQDRQSQLDARQEQTRTRELANRRNDIIMGASFLEGIDQLPPEQRPAFYMSAIQRAQAAGVNIEGAPPQYDESYVGGVMQTARALIRAGQRGQAQQRPYRWRANSGDLMELDANGQPRRVYDDPQDRRQWITHRDPETGEVIAIPAPTGGPSEPQGSDDEWDYEEGGSGSAAPSTFPGGIW